MSTEFTNLTLNNGLTATFLYVDFWSRPVYEITTLKGSTVKVCCTELNGTFLNTYNADWEEPIAPVKNEYQPRKIRKE